VQVGLVQILALATGVTSVVGISDDSSSSNRFLTFHGMKQLDMDQCSCIVRILVATEYVPV